MPTSIASTSAQDRLFIDVCHAVDHAHTKGILHRDLKPSNVLVTTVDDRPVPKMIDFGIAKAVQQRLTDMTLVTQEQQLLGTPQYMSPEQAISGGTDVDTRSDIYSLGAVLYELLTGVPPLDGPTPASSQLEQLQRLTSDRDLPRASTRASAEIGGSCVASSTGSSASAWRRTARRYDSAAGLASDLRAYLEHRPIVAAPPARLYRAGSSSAATRSRWWQRPSCSPPC